MAGRLHPLWVVTIALISVVAGVIAGYELRTSSSGPPTANSGSPVLSITAAGTLGTVFPALASLLANESPGVQAPLPAEQYQGSLSALAAITQLHQLYDVAAAADFRLIPHLLTPTYASWEVAFASNPEVLAYDPTVAALQGINSTNWPGRLQRSGIILGVANASTDPNGYNGIFVLQLEGLLVNGSLGAVYDHFYAGAVGSLARVIPSAAREESEAQAAVLLISHVVQAFIIYQSYAVTHHLSYVNLDPRVNLGNFSPSSLTIYGQASTAIIEPNASLATVRGAPVAFAATVPLNAPNASLGDLFVHLLVTPQGAALLQSFGFAPVLPAYLYAPAGGTPEIVVPETVPLPASLVAEI